MSKRLFRAFTSPSRPARKTPLRTLRLEQFESRCVPSFSMVKDINTSETPIDRHSSAFLGNTYFFSNVDPESGRELWKSDGTPAGTVRVADINPGLASSSPTGFTVLGNQVFFTAQTEESGYEMWKSDGTAAGTMMVKELGPGRESVRVESMAALGDRLLFSSNAGGDGSELWITDGTAEGTHELKDLFPGINDSWPSEIICIGNTAFFVARSETGFGYWRTDGTTAGTVQLYAPHSFNTRFFNFTIVGDQLLFAVSDTYFGVHHNVWRTDGTKAGTVLVHQFDATPHYIETNSVQFDGMAYFTAYDKIGGTRIWKSDGTAKGTVPAIDLAPGSDDERGCTLIAGDSTLYFTQSRQYFYTKIWATDGTQAGTNLIREFNPGTGGNGIVNFHDFQTFGDTLVFITNQTGTGNELWQTDGTVVGTNVLDLNPGPDSSDPAYVNISDSGQVFFYADSRAANIDLFVTDVQFVGVTKLVDYVFATASSSPRGLTRVGDTAYFFADDESGLGLWATDGTTAGTRLSRAIHDLSYDWRYPPQVLGNQITFTLWKQDSNYRKSQSELWISDGTDVGTVLLKKLNLAYGYEHHNSPVVSGGELYFSTYENGLASLWKTDGTLAGTILVEEIVASNQSNEIGNLTDVNGRVFFSVNPGGVNSTQELWISDGTEIGTVKLKSFTGDGRVGEFANVNGILYFAGVDEEGTELWRSDGTESGTYRVADLRPGAGSSAPSNLTYFNGKLYFTANSESSPDREMWKSDGSAAGTVKIVTVDYIEEPHSGYSRTASINNLTPIGNMLYFKDGTGFWELNGETDRVRLIAVSPDYVNSFAAGSTNTPFVIQGNGTIYFQSNSWSDTGQVSHEDYFYDTITDTFGTWDSGWSVHGSISTGEPILLGEQMLVPREDPILGYELWSFNLPPNVRDDFYSVTPDTPLTIAGSGVFGNDHDIEGNAMQAVLVGGPTHGTLELQADGSFLYTPDAGYVGLDQFTYRATDSNEESAIATVKLFVGVPAVAPTISAFDDQTLVVNAQIELPFTVGDDVTSAENLTVTFESVNAGQFPNSAITLGGSGANRTLTLHPGYYDDGFTTIIVTVTDEYGLSTWTTFNVGVHPSPLAPPPPPLDIFDPIAASSGRDVSLYKSDGAWISALTPFPNQPGSVRTASGDFNGDGVLDFVFGTGPGGPSQVKVFDGKTKTMLFLLNPFEASFTGGVNVAAGDVNGDGMAEIAVSPDEGGGPRVRVFNGGNLIPIADFFGIDDPNFRGGARVAIGDMNGDGKGDLVVAAGYGGGPRVAAYDGSQLLSKGGPKLFNDFFAFEQTLRNGISVAAGDVNGDGFADLVAGGGPGGGPRVFILDGKSLVTEGSQLPVPLGNFFAGNPNNRGGIRVAVKDLDGDEKADIVTGAGPGAISSVAAYYGKNIVLIGTPQTGFSFEAFPGQTSGVLVG